MEPGFEQEGAEGEKREPGGATQSVHGNYTSFKGTNLTVVEGMHQFVVYILYAIQRVRRGRTECSKGWGGGGRGFPTALSRFDRLVVRIG